MPDTLRSVREAMADVPRPGELIVVNNNSTDGTAHVAGEGGARVVFEGNNQISRARNAGGREARGEHLIFLDADTWLTSDLLKAALANLESGSCCGGGAVVRSDRPLTFLVAGIFRFWNRLSVRHGLAAGCFVYCLAEAFRETGGFDESVYAGEEVWFSRRLKKWGRKRGMTFTVIADPQVQTSGRKNEWFSTGQLLAQVFLLMLFPFATRWRRLCRIWYYRPGGSG